MQTQKKAQKSSADTAVETPIEEMDTSSTEAILEDCDNCLSDIDAILTEVENREPTDQEIVDDGHPEWRSYYVDYQSGTKNYDQAWEEWNTAHERYKVAYENVTGMAHVDSCTC